MKWQVGEYGAGREHLRASERNYSRAVWAARERHHFESPAVSLLRITSSSILEDTCSLGRGCVLSPIKHLSSVLFASSKWLTRLSLVLWTSVPATLALFYAFGELGY